MSMTHFAFLALLPLVTGPLPQQSRSIAASLCGGGEIRIPIDDQQPPDRPCALKACHAGNCRKQFDPEQIRPRV